MLITTGIGFDNYEIVEYLGIVFAQEVIGTGIFSDTGATVADFLGTRAKGYENKFRNAQDTALREMQSIAEHRGANAIIAIDIDISTLAGNMLVALANGTAVKVRKKQKEENVEIRFIPVVNYANDSVVRIGQAVLLHNMNSGTYHIKLIGRVYNSEKLPIALQVKVDFLSKFKTKIVPMQLDFIQMDYGSKNLFETNILEIKGDVDLSTVDSLKVVLEKYIDEEENIIEEQALYSDINIVTRELIKIKDYNGIDAIGNETPIGEKVMCYCGYLMDIHERGCLRCKRSNLYWTGTAENFGAVQELNQCATGKEVIDYIVMRYDSGDERLSRFKREMVSVLQMEQNGRNLKPYVIKKYNEIFNPPS